MKVTYASSILFAGREHAELRAVVRSTWDLANKVVHGDIGDLDAFTSIQATVPLCGSSSGRRFRGLDRRSVP